MPSEFAYNTVTIDGAALIAQATAANPIVIVGAKSCTLAALDNADLASKPLSWYNGKSGTIAAVSATDAVARIVAKYTNSGTAQTVKSFCVTARLASQSDAQAVVLAAKSDPDAAVVLPGADDVSMIVNIKHAIAINSSGTVEVTPGASASVEDLERFVSLYKAGDPSVGEAQTVLGKKTFATGIATDTLSPQTIDTSGTAYIDGYVKIADGTHKCGLLVSAICNADENLNNTVYLVGDFDRMSGSPSRLGYNTALSWGCFDDLATTRIYNSGSVYVGFTKTGAERGDNGCLVLASDAAILFREENPTDPNIVGSLIPGTNDPDNPDAHTDLGSSAHSWDHVYARKLHNCILPSADLSTYTPEIGCITVIKVFVGTASTLNVGMEIKRNVGTIVDIKTSNLDGTQTTIDSTSSDYKYKVLSYASISQNSSAVVLAMRIE